MPRYPKTLFFTAGSTPTQEEYQAAEEIGQGVMFRNASKIVPGAPLENCDAVAGNVPPDYQAVYGDGDGSGKVLVRPNATRTASSGGADDFRPGTVDDGLAHESGTGSGYAGDPMVERARELRATVDQRAGRNVWEKNPEREMQPDEGAPRFGMNATVPGTPAMGAWPTKGSPGEANVNAEMAPPAAKAAAEAAQGTFADAMERAAESDQRRAETQQRQIEEQQGGAGPGGSDWPSSTDTGRSQQSPQEQQQGKSEQQPKSGKGSKDK